MVDPEGVTEIHGIQDLNEDALDQGVIPNEVALVRDAGEQITLGTELDDHIGAVGRVHDAHEGDDIGMLTGHMVQFDLSLLVLKLAGVESSLVEGLDGIQDMGMNINSGVDDTIGSDAQDSGEFQAVGQ